MSPTRKHPEKRMPEIKASGTEKCREKQFHHWVPPAVTSSEGEQRSMCKN